MRTWIVTGAANGIGKALLWECAARGDRIVGIDRNPIGMTSENLMAMQVDLADPRQVTDAAADIIGRIGEFDVLVNNAGVMPDKDQTEVLPEHVVSVLDTNLRGTILLTESLLPGLKPGGSILCVTSGRSELGRKPAFKDAHTYNFSKAALNEYARWLAARLGERTTVSAVSPGWVKTQMGGPDATDEPADVARALYEHALARIPTGSYGRYESSGKRIVVA